MFKPALSTILAVCLLTAAASAQASFTQNQSGCTSAQVTSGTYAGDTVWYCVSPTAFPDGEYFTKFYAYLAPGSTTFTGYFAITTFGGLGAPRTYLQPLTTFTGNWAGTPANPTNISGPFANWSVNMSLGEVKRSCGTRYVPATCTYWWLLGGTGVQN